VPLWDPADPHDVPGTAVFVTSNIGTAPTVLLHHHKHSRGLHEKVVQLSVRTMAVPFVPAAQRLEIRDLGAGF
jgi:KUP system potassium uptake protein